jgi:hypothetical protein
VKRPVISPKFALGSRVFCISRGQLSQPFPCPTCAEVGTVQLSGETFTCPKCKGRKAADRTVSRWHFSDSFVVGNIGVRLTSLSNYSEYEIHISYMLSTSGTVWPEEVCFASREEADEQCARLNADGAPYLHGGRVPTSEEAGEP